MGKCAKVCTKGIEIELVYLGLARAEPSGKAGYTLQLQVTIR